MESTIVFLAKLVGPLYLVIAPLLLFRSKLFSTIIEDFKKNPALTYFGGSMTLVIGIAWMLAIFSWNNFTEIVFTLFGIIATMKGIILIIFPEAIFKINYNGAPFKIISGLLVVILGIWFTHIGYGLF